METLVVGDSDCPFEAVCNVMLEAGPRTVLFDKWKSLAKSLRISVESMDQLSSQLISETETENGIFLRVLELWRLKVGQNAKLITLVEALENLNLIAAAANLRRNFFLDQGEKTPIPFKPVKPPRNTVTSATIQVEDMQSPTPPTELKPKEATHSSCWSTRSTGEKVVLVVFPVLVLIVAAIILVMLVRRR